MIRNKMKRFDGINVIPLIDVMLVLLAVVLMTASFIVKDSLEVELPETQNTESYQTDKPLQTLAIVIDENNQTFVDNESYSDTEISLLLTGLPKDQAITLEVDKRSQFGSFVKIIDQLKGQNLNNLTILTKADNQSAP